MDRALVIIVLIGISCAVQAAPKLIAVVGNTIGAKQYLSIIQPRAYKPKSLNPQKTYKFDYRTRTKGLTPGEVASKQVDIPNMVQPIFLVGDDEKSITWLRKYKHKLHQLNALGLMVNVQSGKSYKEFSAKTGVHVMPVNGAIFIKRYGLKHYPVLITKHLIEQ